MNTERKPIEQDQGARSARASSGADLVLIPKQLRAEWLDVLAHDAELSRNAKAVALIVSAHFNRYSGDTFVSQETIAAILDADPRVVRRGLDELEARGYVVVKRPEHDRRGADGRRISGGRGIANLYFPALDGERISAMNAGRRVWERAESLYRQALDRAKAKRENPDSGVRVYTEKPGLRSPGLEPERRTKMIGNPDSGVLPTLNPSDLNPSSAPACATEGAAAGALEAEPLASAPAAPPAASREASGAALEPAPATEPTGRQASASPPASEPGAAPIASASETPIATSSATAINLPHEFLAELKVRVGVTFETWFRDVCLIGFEDHEATLVLSAPSRFTRDWLATHYDLVALDAWLASRRFHRGPHLERVEFRVIGK